jgi:hypothetical protein
MRWSRPSAASLCALLLLAVACRRAPTGQVRTAAKARAPARVVPPASVAPGETFTVVAVGDIAGANNAHARTADLVRGLIDERGVAAALLLGDTQYPSGDFADYVAYFHQTWGHPAIRAITRPVPGNHEYAQGWSNAEGYFDYFNGPGATMGIAGERGKGYYSFDMGDWHFVALNSNVRCSKVSCAAASPMHQWLVADLAAQRRKCVLAYWHHPRFQQGTVHGNTDEVAPLWDALYDAGADIVLAGHEHNYQQIEPLDKAGRPDPARGIRSFVAGTGGARLYTEFDDSAIAGAVEERHASDFGVLELTLGPGRYSWRFVPVPGGADAGSAVESRGDGVCH